MWLAHRHFLCLRPLGNQGYERNAYILRSLEVALGLPGFFSPASRHLLAGLCTPAYTDKTPRLVRPAAQAAHRLAAHMDGLGVAMEKAATAGQEPYVVPCLGTEGATAHH